MPPRGIARRGGISGGLNIAKFFPVAWTFVLDFYLRLCGPERAVEAAAGDSWRGFQIQTNGQIQIGGLSDGLTIRLS
jgi:hypothetical protein